MRVEVVAAVVQKDGRYLVCQRPKHKRHGGLWEFPGGKVHKGEGHDAAVRREILEELNVRGKACGPALAILDDPNQPFRLVFLPVEITGVPEPLEHSDIAWLKPAELEVLELAPLDRQFVATTLGSRRAGDHSGKH